MFTHATRRLPGEESGVAAIEYALIASLIAVALLAAIGGWAMTCPATTIMSKANIRTPPGNRHAKGLSYSFHAAPWHRAPPL